MSEAGDGDGDGGDGDGDGARSIVTVATGGNHGCVLFDDGGVRCWGSNEYGQLGYGNLENLGDQPGEMPPPDVDVGGPVVALALGYVHTCALLESGEVRCWGGNFEGQLGLGNLENLGDQPGEMPPSPVALAGTIIEITAGSGHTCALLEGGDVRCWGDGRDGVLGTGNQSNFGDDPDELEPPLLDIGAPVAQLALGTAHSCARIQNGQVRCWGGGNTSSRGYGHTDMVALPSDNLALGTSAATSLSAGHQHTCAGFDDGSVRCWGRGLSGELGTIDSVVGDEPGEMPPALTDVGAEVLEMHATGNVSCALLTGGVARCWGRTLYGLLGIPDRTEPLGDDPGEMPPPDMQLGGQVKFGPLAASAEHVCALTDGADVRCWGRNQFGQLGSGDTEDIGDNPGEMPPPPVPVL